MALRRNMAMIIAAGASFLHAQLVAGAPGDWMEEGRAAVSEARSRYAAFGTDPPRAKNVILFVGDGMGVSTVTAARILEGQLRGESGEENRLSFEHFPNVGLIKTYNTNQQTPDSAGTMTAIITGAKTRAGMISVDESVDRGDFANVSGHRLTTVLEIAEDRGMSTGLVTTTAVTHATPAALYGHSPERGWESDAKLSAAARKAGFPDLARQLIEFDRGDGVDVVLGGGEQNFRPKARSAAESGDRPVVGVRIDTRDLTAEWESNRPGSVFVRSCAELEAVRPATATRLLGLFAPSHLRFEADRAQGKFCEPSLTQMLTAAMKILERNPRGYFLMVEGGRIDHGHHANSAYRALTDVIEFSRAIAVAAKRTRASETLLVVTADHDHVFTIAGYPTRGNDILGLVVSNDGRGRPAKKPVLDGHGRPYTTLGYHNGPGYPGASNAQPEGPKKFPHWAKAFQGVSLGRPNLGAVDTTHRDYLQESAVPLSSETHSGSDVPVYARGPGSHLFHGVQEQSYIFHAMVEALGWNRAGEP
jgi:alkaline phosphatase